MVSDTGEIIEIMRKDVFRLFDFIKLNLEGETLVKSHCNSSLYPIDICISALSEASPFYGQGWHETVLEVNRTLYLRDGRVARRCFEIEFVHDSRFLNSMLNRYLSYDLDNYGNRIYDRYDLRYEPVIPGGQKLDGRDHLDLNRREAAEECYMFLQSLMQDLQLGRSPDQNL